MRRILSLIILFLILWLPGCTTKTKESNPKQRVVQQIDIQVMNNERFNIKEYERRKAEGTTEFEEDDGTMVQQFEVGTGLDINYIEYKTPPPPAPFKTFKRFYGDGTLKIEGQKFHSDFNYGVWKKYDEDGRLIEKTDYEEPYNLSFEEFLTIVRAYHKKKEIPEVNILSNRTTITRQEASPENIWIFSWEAIPGRIEMLKFSDKTGELLQESHYELQDN